MDRLQSQMITLSRSLRTTQFVLLFSLLLNGFVLLGAAQRAPRDLPKDVVTESFILQRPDGKTAATLKVDGDDVALRFFDSKARTRLITGTKNGSEPVTSYFDSAGKNRLSIGLTNQDRPQIVLYDENEQDRFVLHLDPYPTLRMLNDKLDPQIVLAADMETKFQLHDAKGKLRAAACTAKEFTYFQMLNSSEDQPRITLTTGTDRSILGFYSQPARLNLIVGTTPENESGIFLLDRKEEVRAKLTRFDSKVPQLKLIDNTGKTIFEK